MTVLLASMDDDTATESDSIVGSGSVVGSGGGDDDRGSGWSGSADVKDWQFDALRDDILHEDTAERQSLYFHLLDNLKKNRFMCYFSLYNSNIYFAPLEFIVYIFS